MPPRVPRPRLVAVSFPPEQVVYVAESERDAELLSQKLDCPVVLRQAQQQPAGARSADSPRRPPQASERSRSQAIPGTPDVPGAWDVSATDL